MDPQEGGATNDAAAGDAEAKRTRAASAKNRALLAWILAGCAVLAALGFLFALWLREQPKIG
jgi:uncharacterized membrane protein YidH (DUF202 family)